MPSVKLSPIGNDQVVTHAGAPASGWYWSAFAAGSSTPQATYTSSAGTVAQAAQIILNADGVPDNPIWLVAGLAYKFVLYDSSNVSQRTIDNVVGINDTSVSIAQWVASGLTPTYIGANQFSLVGDQTSEFHVGRRVQCLVTAGTVYGIITASSYTSLSTVTVALDAGTLDAGLSAVNLSILRADQSALPKRSYSVNDLSVDGDISLTAGKKIVFEGATDDAFEATIDPGNPTADRAQTMADRSGTLMLGDGTEVGDVIYSIRTSGRTGFIKADGKTIGSAASGATGLASADALSLFTVIWNETANLDYTIQTSAGAGSTRGASAAADFAADKRLPIPNLCDDWFIRGKSAARANGSTQAESVNGYTVNTYSTRAWAYATGSTEGGNLPLTNIGPGTETRPKNVAMTAWMRYLPYQA
jgi:hypothetical protein